MGVVYQRVLVQAPRPPSPRLFRGFSCRSPLATPSPMQGYANTEQHGAATASPPPPPPPRPGPPHLHPLTSPTRSHARSSPTPPFLVQGYANAEQIAGGLHIRQFARAFLVADSANAT